MICEACDKTLARAGQWHMYESECTGCRARAIARSMAAFSAIESDPPDPEPLRQLIKSVLPKMKYADARKAVWSWWELDHAEALI